MKTNGNFQLLWPCSISYLIHTVKCNNILSFNGMSLAYEKPNQVMSVIKTEFCFTQCLGSLYEMLLRTKLVLRHIGILILYKVYL